MYAEKKELNVSLLFPIRPTGASPAIDSDRDGTASEAHPLWRQEHGAELRWRVTDRDQSAGRSRGDHCIDVSLSLDDWNLLPILQAHAGLSPSVKQVAKRYRNSDLLCDHCQHADQSVDRSQTDVANLWNDLLVFHRHVRRRRTVVAYFPIAKTERLNAGRQYVSSALLHAAPIYLRTSTRNTTP